MAKIAYKILALAQGLILAETRLVLNNIYKTTIAFAITALTPTIAWIVFTPFALHIIIFLTNPTALGVDLPLPTLIIRYLFTLMMMCLWILFFAIFVFAVSIMHILFLTIPIFLVANRLKVIHWYTVLPTSFFIGGAPYIFFIWGNQMKELIFIPIIMGTFGFSAGIVFWLLWRYWVSPENYTKKAISVAPYTP